MKKICIILVATLALPGIFTSTAQAKPYHHKTVGWIVANRDNLSVDDDYVTLVGHVTRRMGDEEYWFTDGTGSVRLDSENFDLPIGTRIAIGGRIDEAYLGFGHLEVDVRNWHYAPLGKHPIMHPVVVNPGAAPAPTATAPTPAPAPAASTPAPAPASAPAPVEPATTAPAPAATAPAAATPATPALSPPADTSATNVTAPPGK